MFDAIASVLAWFYSLVPNYAVAIALLTLAIYTVLTPLTLKGTRSMMAMQQYQPEIRRLQQKYKGDRQKLNEEMLAFYQEHQINPLGGCLPLLVQLPVFLVLFRVIRGMTKTTVDAAGNVIGDPSYLHHDSQLYKDLRDAGGEMVAFGMDLGRSANVALKDSVVDFLPYLLLTLVYLGVIFVQQRQMQARRAAAPQPTGPLAGQQKLLQYLPFLFVVMSIFFPAALVIYFIFGAVARIAQQGYIRRTSPDLGASAVDAKGKGSAAKGKSGGKSSGTKGTGSKGTAAKGTGTTGARRRPPSAKNPSGGSPSAKNPSGGTSGAKNPSGGTSGAKNPSGGSSSSAGRRRPTNGSGEEQAEDQDTVSETDGDGNGAPDPRSRKAGKRKRRR